MKKKNVTSILLLSIIVVLGWIKSIPAETYNASNLTEFQSFLNAAEESPESDTIKLEAGVYNVGIKLTYKILNNGNLTIEQENPGYDVILNGGNVSRILEITNSGGTNETITITGITFRNAIGTALNVAAPEIKIENSKFIDNTPDFDLSPATRLGGGAELTGKVTLMNNLFEGNYGSPDMCGGVTILGGPIKLDSNIFVDNSGGGPYLSLNGGGVCIRPSLSLTDEYVYNDIILTNNVFDANTCSSFYGCPGGLYVAQVSVSGEPPRVIITNNTFINNLARQMGGTAGAAVALSTGSLDIHNNIFWNNLDSSFPQVLRDLAVTMPANGVTFNVTYNLFSDDDPTSHVWTTQFGSEIQPDLKEENIYNKNPNLSTGYHLPDSPPAKDTGNNSALGRPDFDFEGDERPSNNEDQVDRGADEYTPPQANISISPPSLVFPDTVVMQSSTPLDVVISNIGALALDITGISLDDTTNFSLDTGTCGTSINIAPGGSCTVSLTFNPKTVESFNASLTIVSTDPDSPSKEVTLTGNVYILSGDINNDGNIDLADTILALKAVSNLTPQPVYKGADINDGKIGLEEAIYTLQVIAEKRP